MIESLLDQEPVRVALVTIVGASLLALVALIGAHLIRQSARLRHGLLAASLLLVLALPLLSRVAPPWSPFPASRERESTTSREPARSAVIPPSGESSTDGHGQETPAPMRRLHWLGAIWLAGFAAMILRRVNDLRARRLMLRDSIPASAGMSLTCASVRRRLGIRRPIDLRLSGKAAVPMTWGLARPVLLLPADACSWEPERVRIVLVHELAHVARLDAMTRAVADGATLIHWYNPLVIGAARALRRTAEQACDDIVLGEGISRRSYVDTLVDLARHSRSHRLTEAVITSSELERRVTAIADAGRARNRESSRFPAAIVAVLLGALMLSAGIGRPAPKPLSGDDLEIEPARPATATGVAPNPAPATPIADLRRSAGEPEAEFAPRLRRMLEEGAAPGSVLAASRDLRTDAERQALLGTILAAEPDLIPAIVGELRRLRSDAALEELIIAICSRAELSPDLVQRIVTEAARLRSAAARTETIVAIAATQPLDQASRTRLRQIALRLPSGSRERALASLE